MFLSRSDKQKGQKNYLSYTFINGLGYSFMAETIIYLLAMNYGAGNVALGYISSAVYLTGIVVFFVPLLFPGVKIVNLFFAAWLIRGLIGMLYGLTPSLSGEGAVVLTIIIYSLYCLLRNIAYPLNPIIQGMITKPSERGHYSSRVLMVLYASMMLSRFISFGTLSFFGSREMEGILLLLGIGILLNTAASFAVKRVPVGERVQKRNLHQAVRLFFHYMQTPRHLIFILLYCGGMSLIVLFNFSIPFLRRVSGVASNLIFIFTTTNFLGVIISSRLARPFLDRFGSKPLLTLVNLVIALLSLVWIFWGQGPVWGYFLLGFISMFFIGMIRLLLERLVINTIPEDDRIGFSSTIAVVFSLFSLLVGLSGGALADFSLTLSFPVPHEYALTFGLMGVMAFVNFLLSLFLKETGSLTANQFLTILADPRNLKTIHNIDLLKRVNNNVRKQSILIELESDQSHLATQEIKNRLHLSTLRDKEMVIRSLFSHPRPELEEELIEEALDPYSWWRQSAIFALGAYPTLKTRSALRKIFKETYPYLRSVASKSMARIGDFSGHEDILKLLSTKGLDARTYLNLVIALSLIERDGAYWTTIFRIIADKTSHRFIQSMMIIGSTRQNFQPPVEDLFYELNLSEEGGFDAILEELADLEIPEEEFYRLMALMKEKNYLSLWSWCRNRCKELKLLEPYEQLRQSIISYKKRSISPSLALAGLYFTMQLEILYTKQKASLKLMPE